MHLLYTRTSLETQSVKNLSVMQKTQIQSLGWEDPLDKEMATHSSILTWRIPWTQEPGELQSMRSQRVGHDWGTNPSLPYTRARAHTHTHTQTITIAGGKGETKDHMIRFSDTEHKDTEKIENDFIFLLDPSFSHQISREPTN